MVKPNDLQNCVSYRNRVGGGVELAVGPRRYSVSMEASSLDALHDALRRSATQAAIGMVSLGDPLGPQELGEGWSQLELWPAQVILIRKAAAFAGTLPCLSSTELAKALGVTRQAIQSRLKTGSLQAFPSQSTKLIPLDQLEADEQTKAMAFLKEMQHAQHPCE